MTGRPENRAVDLRADVRADDLLGDPWGMVPLILESITLG
jgi:hypothetical protein